MRHACTALAALVLCACGERVEAPTTIAPPSVALAPEPAPEPEAAPEPPPVAERAPRPAWTRRLRLEHAAYETPGPSAIVHAPEHFDPTEPLHLVVFFHGYSGCVEVLFSAGEVACAEGLTTQEGWDLGGAHDAAGTRTLLLMAQLAFQRREGSPGRLGREAAFAAFLDEVLARIEPDLGRPVHHGDLASVTVLAHSAAFETSIALVRRGGVRIRHLVLFDALYAGGPVFAAWAAGDEPRTLVSFTTGGSTARRTRDLALLARRRGLDLVVDPAEGVAAAHDHRIVLLHTRAPHGEVPARHMAETLRALDLPRR